MKNFFEWLTDALPMIISIFIITAVFMSIASYVEASPADCKAVSSMIEFAAIGRDIGVEPAIVYDSLLMEGVNKDVAKIVVSIVFEEAELTKEELQQSWMDYCTGPSI